MLLRCGSIFGFENKICHFVAIEYLVLLFVFVSLQIFGLYKYFTHDTQIKIDWNTKLINKCRQMHVLVVNECLTNLYIVALFSLCVCQWPRVILIQIKIHTWNHEIQINTKTIGKKGTFIEIKGFFFQCVRNNQALKSTNIQYLFLNQFNFINKFTVFIANCSRISQLSKY